MKTKSNWLNWNIGAHESQLIHKIVVRASEKYPKEFDRLSLDMDITACHLNGTPLRLEELLATDDFNFSHDIFGIARHINRATGKLENHFLPRFYNSKAPKRAYPVTA